MVRIMTSQENRRLGRRIFSMAVHDNPAKPFAHCLPLRLQGDHFTQLRLLELASLYWTATGPHPLFFRHISYFSKVEELRLSRCHLHRADDLWNILSAIPSLQMVHIESVTVELNLFGQHTKPASEHLPKLRTLNLLGEHVERPGYLPPVLPRIIVDVLSLLSTLTRLSLELNRFSTFEDLERLIGALPALNAISISKDPSWQFPTTSASPFFPPIDTRNAKAWRFMSLDVESSSIALGFLTSFPLAAQLNALRDISVTLLEIPSLDLQMAVSQILEHSGATLERLEWKWRAELSDSPLADPEVSVLHEWPCNHALLIITLCQCAHWPSVPSLIHNITLEEIFVTIPLPSALLYFHRALLALLTSVMSPRLRSLWMAFDGHPSHWKEVGDLSLSEDAIDTFHACLLRDVFAGLEKNNVTVWFDSAIDVDVSDDVRAWVARLFTPWLARSVLKIELPDSSVIDAIPETLPLEAL
ncbi:hypothetical protein C8Q72DRAFT_836632, partial [Fomitopsis betulina]